MARSLPAVFALFLAIWLVGGHGSASLSAEHPLSPEEALLMVSARLKKGSFLLSPRTRETPYTFSLSIDGMEFKEHVTGVEEVDSEIDAERGRGILYVLKKELRLEPGSHEITLNTEEGVTTRVEIELEGGRRHTLKFESVYGPRKVDLKRSLRTFGVKRSFRKGFLFFRVYLDGKRAPKER